MIKIKAKQAKRYRVIDVAKALALSEGAVSGYFNNRGISTKAGLTIEQLYELCKGRRRGDIRWNDVKEIREELLTRYGVEIIESNEDDEKEE